MIINFSVINLYLNIYKDIFYSEYEIVEFRIYIYIYILRANVYNNYFYELRC